MLEYIVPYTNIIIRDVCIYIYIYIYFFCGNKKCLLITTNYQIPYLDKKEKEIKSYYLKISCVLHGLPTSITILSNFIFPISFV